MRKSYDYSSRQFCATNLTSASHLSELRFWPNATHPLKICWVGFDLGIPVAPCPELTRLHVLEFDEVELDNISLHAFIGQHTPLIWWAGSSSRWLVGSGKFW